MNSIEDRFFYTIVSIVLCRNQIQERSLNIESFSINGKYTPFMSNKILDNAINFLI